MTTGTIFNIQKCSIHDGSGIRTIIFLKGCPLRCVWCANPESQKFQFEVMCTDSRCIGCGACIRRCPNHAISAVPGGSPVIDREVCKGCFACTEICYAESKKICGKVVTVSEVVEEVIKDARIYKNSGGGITFSGGEPLQQPEFCYEVAKACREYGMEVGLETCGYADYERFAPLLSQLTSMFFDIKQIDAKKHQEITGAPLSVILDNLVKISAWGVPITVRTPIIPGYNDDMGNIRGIAEFIKQLPNIAGYELLAYHNLGEAKYQALGRQYALTGAETPSVERMRSFVQAAEEVLEESSIHCFYLEP